MRRAHRTHTAHRTCSPNTSRISTADRTAIETCITICSPSTAQCTCAERIAMHLHRASQCTFSPSTAHPYRAMLLQRAHRTHTAHRTCSPNTSRISTADRTAIETCITICSERIAMHLHRVRKSRPRNAIGFRLFCNRSASRQTLRPRFTKLAPYAKPFFSSAKTSVIYLYDRFRRSAVFIFPRGLKPADDSIIEPLSPAPT